MHVPDSGRSREALPLQGFSYQNNTPKQGSPIIVASAHGSDSVYTETAKAFLQTVLYSMVWMCSVNRILAIV